MAVQPFSARNLLGGLDFGKFAAMSQADRASPRRTMQRLWAASQSRRS